MKRFSILLVSLFFFVFSKLGWALDPVTPVSQRGSGFIEVVSPLSSDICELSGSTGKRTFQSGETISVPVGEYQLKVKMQNNYEWSTTVTVHSTERTTVPVVGYGNLKVNAPASAKVHVSSGDNQVSLKSFPASEVQTLPTGTYRVKIQIGGGRRVETTITIVSNSTREVSVN